MKNEDLQFISTLGKALYANSSQAESRSLETVAAISTLEGVSEEQFLDRAFSLMLHQAQRDGLRASQGGVASPFFRLSPKERFVLFLLHSGRMSYRKLARLLEVTPEDIESLAWAARTHIASAPEIRRQAPHPSGSSRLNHHCPEFNVNRPWTQRLIDDELGVKERTFIQNHTSVCTDCFRALASTRELYYAVERTIPLQSSPERAAAVNDRMKKTLRWNRMRGGALPNDLTFGEALQLFFTKRENAAWLALLGVVLFAIAWSSSR